MGRQLVALVVVGLFLAGLVGIGLGASPGGPVEQVDGGNASTATISVSGDGTVTAEPDQAVVALAVTATGTQPSAATDTLANETAGLRDALRATPPVSSVTTTGYQLFEREENRTRSYVARQSFELVVDDPDVVGRVVDIAVAAGATSVDGASFTLSEDRRRELRETALDRAVEDARAEATTLAASSNLVLGPVRSLSTGGDGVGPVAETALRGGTVIDQGPVTVRATVQVTYAAEPGPSVEPTPTAGPANETVGTEQPATATAATDVPATEDS